MREVVISGELRTKYFQQRMAEVMDLENRALAVLHDMAETLAKDAGNPIGPDERFKIDGSSDPPKLLIGTEAELTALSAPREKTE